MVTRQRHQCPLCKTLLSKEKYDEVVGRSKEQKQHIKHLEEELQRNRQELKRRTEEAARKARESVRAEVQRQIQGKERYIKKLEQTIGNLKKKTTPQAEGRLDEQKLLEILQRRFPEDVFRHTGKNGDIVQDVRSGKKHLGRIVYECKLYDRIASAHLKQAYKAKASQRADYAVLVTHGKRRGFDGLDYDKGVIVVAPFGAPAITQILRISLLEIAKNTKNRKERARIADRLAQFLKAREFKGPIQDVIERTNQLSHLMFEESKRHKSDWENRLEHYTQMHWDASTVKNKVERILLGQEPLAIERAKPEPLRLPWEATSRRVT